MNTLRLRNNEPPAPRLSRCAAFTIIELLVVIGLMAILVSLVIPSLGRARGIAESVGCRANLRQMGTAFARRTADHRGQLNMFSSSWHRYTDDPRELDPGESLTLHMLSYIIDVPEGAPPNANGVWPEDWPYYRGNLVSFATCPTLHRAALSDCIISSTYIYNKLAGMPIPGSTDNWSMDDRVPTMNHIQSPGDMLMFSDGVPTSTNHFVDDAWWYRKAARRVYLLGTEPIPESPIVQLGHYPPYVHDRHLNLVYMDGHAGSYTMDEMRSRNEHYWQTAEQERFWRGRTSPSY